METISEVTKRYLSFYLPPSPTQTASYFRGSKGWFTDEEEVIMVNRIIRDDPSKGDMHNRQALSPSLFWEAIKDYDMWPIYLLGLSENPKHLLLSVFSLTLKSLEHPSNALAILHHANHWGPRIQHV